MSRSTAFVLVALVAVNLLMLSAVLRLVRAASILAAMMSSMLRQSEEPTIH